MVDPGAGAGEIEDVVSERAGESEQPAIVNEATIAAPSHAMG